MSFIFSQRGLAGRGCLRCSLGALPLLATYHIGADRRLRPLSLELGRLLPAQPPAIPGEPEDPGRRLSVFSEVGSVLVRSKQHDTAPFSRYLTLTPDEFRNGPMGSGLLTEEESDSILFELLRPGSSLPDHLAPLRRVMSQSRR